MMIHDQKVTFKLSKEVKVYLDKVSEDRRISRSQLLREMIDKYKIIHGRVS